MGVDVFFVISGFLITRQLVESVGRQGVRALPIFYARRIKRLLPAAAVVVAATVLVARFYAAGAAGSLDHRRCFLHDLLRFELPARGRGHPIPASGRRSVAVAALLVARRRGTVLRRLAAADSRGRMDRRSASCAHCCSVAWAPRRPCRSTTRSQSPTPPPVGLLLAAHPRLGAGPGCARRTRRGPPGACCPRRSPDPSGGSRWARWSCSAFVFDDTTHYPGSVAAVPVVAAAALIACGCGARRNGVERILRNRRCSASAECPTRGTCGTGRCWCSSPWSWGTS